MARTRGEGGGPEMSNDAITEENVASPPRLKRHLHLKKPRWYQQNSGRKSIYQSFLDTPKPVTRAGSSIGGCGGSNL